MSAGFKPYMVFLNLPLQKRHFPKSHLWERITKFRVVG